jgi:hypothetical protein
MELGVQREKLYKYRSLDGAHKARVERMFTHNELYFPSPHQFNDPFDCRVELSLGGSDNEKKEYIARLISQYSPDISPADKISLKSRMLRTSNLRNIGAEVLDQITNDLGIFSLSKKSDDILMWSHYANSHRGVCLGFFAGPGDDFFRISQEVRYRPDYPSTKLNDDQMTRMEATILTKSDHWSYEEEYRIIDYASGPGIKTFPPDLLACVIMGCQIDEQDREDVIRWSRNSPSKPSVFQAKKTHRDFSLQLREIIIR